MNFTAQHRNLAKLVAEAQKLTTYEGVAWENFCWDVTRYINRSRAHDKRRLKLYFTQQRKSTSEPYVPFEPKYADFAKAIILKRASQRMVGYAFQKAMLVALRYLYGSLVRGGTTDPTLLETHHFQAAVLEACRTVVPSSAYRIGALLREVADFVNDNQITLIPIRFNNPIPHPPEGDGTDPQSQAEGLEKMPSRATLEALADASNNPLDDEEKILLRVIDLHVVGGFRTGEAATIPLDCWVEEAVIGRDGRPKIDETTGEQVKRFGLRYWPEKGGETLIKWLPDCAVPLARRAVEDLTRLCTPARSVAATLEHEPDRVPLPGNYHPDELLDRNQLVKVLGLSCWGSARCFLDKIKIRPVERERGKGRGGHRNLYRVREIERALVNRRARLEVVTKPNGKKQKLSESLCVMFRNQFDSCRATLYFLPELIGYRQICTALGSAPDATSVFSRRGLTEPDGSPIRIKTHAFRHWLNTLADRGGLSDVELALWMGRRDVRQNQAYKHGTVEQRVAWAREMIGSGKLQGPVTDKYNTINDPVEKEHFLEVFVNVAHFTPLGVCVHDFGLDPCPYHLNCLRGCTEYLRTKGDEEERKNIRELRVFTARELEKAEQAMLEDEYNASNWVEHSRLLLTGADAALAVDDDPCSEGELIQVFPSGEMRGQPLA
jgi:hypothetical protein